MLYASKSLSSFWRQCAQSWELEEHNYLTVLPPIMAFSSNSRLWGTTVKMKANSEVFHRNFWKNTPASSLSTSICYLPSLGVVFAQKFSLGSAAERLAGAHGTMGGAVHRRASAVFAINSNSNCFRACVCARGSAAIVTLLRPLASWRWRVGRNQKRWRPQ